MQEHMHEDRMRRGREWQETRRGLDGYPKDDNVTKEFHDMYDLEARLSQLQKRQRNFARETFLKTFEERYFRQAQQEKALKLHDGEAQEFTPGANQEQFVDILVGYRGLLVPNGHDSTNPTANPTDPTMTSSYQPYRPCHVKLRRHTTTNTTKRHTTTHTT
jgi:hypothetical protein